tara:strand:- start:1623 stop:1895 length:273 start_codon:yes stop_codon:yes gene_type:complete
MSRIEDEVCKKIQQRAEVGRSKYGVTMDIASLSRIEWLIHAQEEAMDLAVYLQKLIDIEKGSSLFSTMTQLGGMRTAAFPSDWTKKEESE